MKNNKLAILLKGIIAENPVLILVLGTCPTLATTGNVISALSMGLAATFVLVCSNAAISALRKVIPDTVRIPCYIVIIAGFVTILEMSMQAFLPEIYDMLGVYLALIVVNCIILGRAEMFARKNNVIDSALDGLGMGLGFTVALTLIGLLREFLGAGTLFSIQVIPDVIPPIAIFIMAPGAFFVLACLTALQNKLNAPSATNRPEGEAPMACGGNCAKCAGSCGAGNHQAVISDVTARKEAAIKEAKAAAAKAAAEKKAAAERAKALQAEKAAETVETTVGGDSHD